MLNSYSKTKYKFSRSKWYVTPRFSPYEQLQERVKWCTAQFGPEPTAHDAWSRWYTWHGVIKFRDAEDYAWFVLRWGQ